jgi:predicted ATPase
MTMRRPGFALALLLFAGTASAGDHLVTLRAADERVQEAAVVRQADANAVDAVLARPEAKRAIEVLGQDPERLRAAVAALSDGELRDLAQRAQALRADPTAALSGDVNQLLIIFLIVAIVILVLQAVD